MCVAVTRYYEIAELLHSARERAAIVNKCPSYSSLLLITDANRLYFSRDDTLRAAV